MNKRLILISILLMLLSTTIFAPVIFAEKIEGKSTFIGLFNSQINFEVEKDLPELILPGESKTVEFMVKYKLDMGNLIFRLLTKRRIGRLFLFGPGYILKFLKGDPKAIVNLSVECPIWCSYKLEPEYIEFTFSNTFQVSDKIKLEVTVDKNAPALEKSDIEIKADFPGLWTIKEVSNSTSFSFLPKYVSNLTVESEIEHTIPPLKNYTVPINITNNGNGDSKVNVQIIDSDNWTISLDNQDFTLNTQKTQQILLTLAEPPKNFKEKSIKLVITPTSTQDIEESSYLEGDKIEITYTFINDGSFKEENNGVNLTNIAIIVIVIIFILVLILFILRKRK